jgi:hypothetical protein
MSEPSRSPRKKRRFAPPIDLDELYSAPNLRGMCSFLERPPEQAHLLREQRHAVDAAVSTLVEIAPPVSPFPAIPTDSTMEELHITRGSDMHTDDISPGDSLIASPPYDIVDYSFIPNELNISLPPSDMSISQPPSDISIQHPPGDMLITPGGRTLRVQRCILAQDGHSSGEQALYVALWNEGSPDGSDARLVTIGQGILAKRVRMDITNVRKNLRLLEQKLSIEITSREVSDQQQGKTYRIFSYRRILENRQKVGMEWIVKSKGVTFVNPPPAATEGQGTKAPQTTVVPQPKEAYHQGGLASREYYQGGAKHQGGAPGKTPGGGDGDMQGLSLLDLNLREYIVNTSSLSTVVGRELRSVLQEIDDDAVKTLCHECRKRAPDCSPEEIIHCFRSKAGQLLRFGKPVRNPVGLMLRAVPKCFEGTHPLYLRFRQTEQIRREQEKQAEQQWHIQMAEYQRLAQDPDTPPEERDWYTQLLAGPRTGGNT